MSGRVRKTRGQCAADMLMKVARQIADVVASRGDPLDKLAEILRLTREGKRIEDKYTPPGRHRDARGHLMPKPGYRYFPRPGVDMRRILKEKHELV